VCENLPDAENYMTELVSKHLNAGEIIQLQKQIGFVEASIGRMVPVQTEQMQDGNILRICSEKYSILPVNKETFKGRIPDIPGIIPYENFDFFIKRKLFIHNMGHAVCAYLGLLLGEIYISDVISITEVLFIVKSAMLESAHALKAEALNKKYTKSSFENTQTSLPERSYQDLIDHTNDLLCRFNNKALMDTCDRVGADIERKLGPSDRFIGAINFCIDQGVTPVFISIGAAAALRCLIQTEENASAILETTSQLKNDSAAAKLILDMYRRIIKGDTFKELLEYALEVGKKGED